MGSTLLHIADDACPDARLQGALVLARGSRGLGTCPQTKPRGFVLLEGRPAGKSVSRSWPKKGGPQEENSVPCDLVVVGCRHLLARAERVIFTGVEEPRVHQHFDLTAKESGVTRELFAIPSPPIFTCH